MIMIQTLALSSNFVGDKEKGRWILIVRGCSAVSANVENIFVLSIGLFLTAFIKSSFQLDSVNGGRSTLIAIASNLKIVNKLNIKMNIC